MGDVYAADAPDGQRVALKVLRLDAGNRDELHRRFRREAELCKSINHPNVVTVTDYGVHDGAPYMTMRLLEGRDLESWLEELGALSPEVAVAIALEACAGLAAAHARGIVHRDFKPANVFLDEREGFIRAVVCDFGIAKVYDEDGALTASGAVLGTPLYMAPEQLLDSKHVDARCDVWAVGMVLYHALAGRAAFADVRGIGDLVVLFRDCNVPPLQTFAPWIPASLARVVHAALLPLDRRFATVDEFARALRLWGPEPVTLQRTALVRLADDRRSRVATHAVLPKSAAELGTP
ncbi:MAG TPA: serine/threonine-protein kinase, partial [Labilithrix sp.]